MNADDDGFCEHFTVMRMTESKPDDLKVLQAKGFVTIFDDKVLVITDWKENNYLRNDRYTPSKYLEIYKNELERLSSGIPLVDKRYPQVRLGKVRLGKVRLGKNTESYGELEKVKLTIEEYNKLCEKLSEPIVKELITELDLYLASKGDKYKDHYAVIQSWARRKISEHHQRVTSKGKNIIGL
jgi:hypothetical protein